MNAERLLAHYEKIVDAPDTIARLRRYILDLAVRGKLVPQDASDEPASEVLKRLLLERRKAWELEKGKTKRNYVPPEHEEGQFELPRLWTWASALELCKCIESGSTPSAAEMFEGSGDIPYIKVYNLTFTGNLDFSVKPTFVSRATHEKKLGRSRVIPGDVLMNIVGPPLGKVSIVPNLYPEWNTNQAVVLFRPLAELLPEYLSICLRSLAVLKWILELAQQTVGQVNISVSKSRRLPIPLPPLAEQHRIVATVAELMSLCDQLEAAQVGRERSRDRLAAASLARLQAPDTETFQADARFALAALAALTTRPDQIKALRQTILNLAVRGKLVPQDPNDEPASEVGLKIKNRGRGQVQETIESPFGLPIGWAWRAIDTLADQVTDGEHATPPRILESQIPLVTAKNVREGFMDYSQTDWVSLETAQKAWGRCRPQVGDLLLVCVGATTGRLTVLRQPRDMVLVRSVALIRPNSDVLDEYLERAIRSPVVQQQIWASVKAAAQPCLYINRIQSLLIPLPPFAEQHRIVTKVDALMALCDRLEASLAAAAATRRRLLDALLAEALAPANVLEQAAA